MGELNQRYEGEISEKDRKRALEAVIKAKKKVEGKPIEKMSQEELEEEVRKAQEKHEACVNRLQQVGKSNYEYKLLISNILSANRALAGLCIYLLHPVE